MGRCLPESTTGADQTLMACRATYHGHQAANPHSSPDWPRRDVMHYGGGRGGSEVASHRRGFADETDCLQA